MKLLRLLGVVYVLGVVGCAASLNKKDLELFLNNREICDHLRGEIPEPSDAERLKEVISDINKYCAGTDQQLKALKRRYADDPEVMATLNSFEEHIESRKRER